MSAVRRPGELEGGRSLVISIVVIDGDEDVVGRRSSVSLLRMSHHYVAEQGRRAWTLTPVARGLGSVGEAEMTTCKQA